jgi:hypothetical protein
MSQRQMIIQLHLFQLRLNAYMPFDNVYCQDCLQNLLLTASEGAIYSRYVYQNGNVFYEMGFNCSYSQLCSNATF